MVLVCGFLVFIVIRFVQKLKFITDNADKTKNLHILFVSLFTDELSMWISGKTQFLCEPLR
jgi:hypothetical protein